MRILILWADDRSFNLGVRALAEGTEALARQVWPDAEFSFLTWGRRDAPMPAGDPKALLRELVTRRRGMVAWLAGFDLVLDTRAGDSFADIYGVGRHAAMTLLAELVRRSRTVMVMCPQTIGPFTTRLGRLLARRSMSSARLVMARDSTSAERAGRLNRRAHVVTTDVVFAIAAPPRRVTRDVLLNISGLLWHPSPHVDHETYRRVVRELYARLRASGRQVSLLAHVLESDYADNDEQAIRAFVRDLDEEPEVIIPSSLADVRRVVASANLVIGSRMHACLNALSVGTPAVALAYSRKFEPLLRDIGWTATVNLRGTGDPVSEVMAMVMTEAVAERAAATADRAHALIVLAQDALREVA